MFFVVTFNSGIEDFEYIGAFSKRDEAEQFAEAKTTPFFKPVVAEMEFKFVIDKMTQTRLGAMAQVVAVQGIAPWPAQVWIVEKDGILTGVFLQHEAALKAFHDTEATRCFSVDVGLLADDSNPRTSHRKPVKVLYGPFHSLLAVASNEVVAA